MEASAACSFGTALLYDFAVEKRIRAKMAIPVVSHDVRNQAQCTIFVRRDCVLFIRDM
jgi:hypothetical protein